MLVRGTYPAGKKITGIFCVATGLCVILWIGTDRKIARITLNELDSLSETFQHMALTNDSGREGMKKRK